MSEEVESKEKKYKGRQKGSVNKRTQMLREKYDNDPNFVHPIDYLIEVYMDKKQSTTLRVKAACEVLPYLEAKLKQIEIGSLDNEEKSNEYTWLPPEPEGTIPMATMGASMDDAE